MNGCDNSDFSPAPQLPPGQTQPWTNHGYYVESSPTQPPRGQYQPRHSDHPGSAQAASANRQNHPRTSSASNDESNPPSPATTQPSHRSSTIPRNSSGQGGNTTRS